MAGRRTRAQNMVEYGLLIAGIAVAVLIGVYAFGSVVHEWFMHLVDHITTTITAVAVSSSRW